ncbi:MAG: hypothetical protein C0423_22260 [Methylibium sp.]|nr:hypothetical protein [Methylibium sp.]
MLKIRHLHQRCAQLQPAAVRAVGGRGKGGGSHGARRCFLIQEGRRKGRHKGEGNDRLQPYSASLAAVRPSCPHLLKTQPVARTRHAPLRKPLESVPACFPAPTPDPAMPAEITQLLRAASQGDAGAADQVVALLYGDLRRIAGRRMQQSGDMTLLDATALVHESYLKLQRAGELDFADRKQFLAYAAKVMHNIVIDQIRARQADKRGGEQVLLTLNTAIADLAPQGDEEVLRVHEALAELAEAEPRLAQVVEMRYFAGLTEAEIAEALDITERTVQRDWAKARLFLAVSLKT